MSRYRTVCTVIVAGATIAWAALASSAPQGPVTHIPSLADHGRFEQATPPRGAGSVLGAQTERAGTKRAHDRPMRRTGQPPRRAADGARIASGIARGAGNTWFVNAALATGADDGTSWDDAFRGAMGLQQALAVAQSGDAVWIAAGTYLPSDVADRNASFVIPDGVKIYGGFAGGEINLEDRDPAVNEVILSGDLLGDDGPDFANIADNSRHVVDASGVSAATRIDGVTIRAGFAEGNGSLLNAAGLQILSGSPEVHDCVFEFNTARRGGAVYIENGSPDFTDCRFENNRAQPDEATGEGNGGAVSIMLGSMPTFTQCSFTFNSARIGGAMHIAGAGVTLDTCDFSFNQVVFSEEFFGALGGAIFMDTNDSVAATSCTFLGNTARQGGALDIEGGAPNFTGCTFNGNIASTTEAAGGGLGGAATVAFGSTATFDDCDFLSNAGRVGGAVHVFDAQPTFTLCDFDDNEAVADAVLGGGFGGAVNLLTDAHATFTTCTFDTNEARQGGGVQIEDSLPVFDDCTFFVNSAPTAVTNGFGGAVLCFTGGDAQFTGTTFTGNTSTFGGAIFSFAATPMFDTCTFNLNGADQSGGAMYLQDSGAVALAGCMFDTNTSFAGGGGAVYLDTTPASVTACTFDDNEATGGSGGGLAIIDGSTATVFDCTFTGNDALNGGGVRVNGSTATLLACSFIGNSASSAGGGIDFVAASSASMRSCVAAGNTGGFGGGVHVSGLGPTLANLTVTENISANGAGVRSSNVGDITIVNSIIWNNDGDETDTGPASTITISFSNVQGGVARGGTGNIDADPLFSNPPGGDYTLTIGSLCIDAGSNADADPCNPDRALGIRIVDGAGSEVVDMGAYEFGAGVFSDCNGNLVLDACDIAAMVEQDCNNNGIPDSCDIAAGGWADDDANMIPDLCERIDGDVNGDGIVDLDDLLAVIGNWGGCDGDCLLPCVADIDFDCIVALGDLLDVIGNWGSMGP